MLLKAVYFAFAIALLHLLFDQSSARQIRVKWAKKTAAIRNLLNTPAISDHRVEQSPLPIVDAWGFAMLGDVLVGSPAQTVTVDFNLFMSDLWLNDKRLDLWHGFDPSESSTFVNTSKHFEVVPGVEGWWASDIVAVRPLSFSSVSRQDEFQIPNTSVSVNQTFGFVGKTKRKPIGILPVFGISPELRDGSFLKNAARKMRVRVVSIWMQT
ncbi:hypothetical protein AAVH_34673, partial [Aphelenchoides avenae]